MSVNIKQFRYSADNFGYLVYSGKSAMAIDAGAVDAILDFVAANSLDLEFVTNTHMHPDHTMGTDAVLKRSGAEYIQNSTLRADGQAVLGDKTINIYHTPGHKKDSVVFHVDGALITGDTLFNGTIGNCFSGDMDGFFDSIKLLLEFPGETLVYAGHDYVRESLDFARMLEPGNEAIDRFLAKYDPGHVVSTMDEENRINPYLRFNEPSMARMLESRGLPAGSEKERWFSLMSIE